MSPVVDNAYSHLTGILLIIGPECFSQIKYSDDRYKVSKYVRNICTTQQRNAFCRSDFDRIFRKNN